MSAGAFTPDDVDGSGSNLDDSDDEADDDVVVSTLMTSAEIGANGTKHAQEAAQQHRNVGIVLEETVVDNLPCAAHKSLLTFSLFCNDERVCRRTVSPSVTPTPSCAKKYSWDRTAQTSSAGIRISHEYICFFFQSTRLPSIRPVVPAFMLTMKLLGWRAEFVCARVCVVLRLTYLKCRCVHSSNRLYAHPFSATPAETTTS